VTVITDPLFYALAIPAVLALGLSKGGFVGVGQMALPLFALAMPPLEAAAIMLPIMIVQDAFAVWVYRKSWDRRIFTIVICGMTIGVGIAWAVASVISESAVRLFVGVLTVAFAIYGWIGPQAFAAELDRDIGKPGVAGGLFWGAMSGFASTICQAASPPYQMYVLRLNLPKMVFVGTTAMVLAALNWIKVVPYVALGQFTAKGFATSLILLPLALATNQLGFWLVKKVPTEAFYKIILVLMFVVGLELTRGGVVGLWHG
jgi:uncharacterized membrane protein YfcA